MTHAGLVPSIPMPPYPAGLPGASGMPSGSSAGLMGLTGGPAGLMANSHFHDGRLKEEKGGSSVLVFHFLHYYCYF